MSKVQSEYDVEIKFIDRLESIGYEYVELKHYDESGKKKGHSTPGLFGDWKDYDD